MSKWFEKIDCKNSNVIYSRIRLARNWDEYVFPSRMTATQCGEMVERLGEGLKGLKDQDGRDLSYSQLDQMQELEKMASGSAESSTWPASTGRSRQDCCCQPMSRAA